MLLCSSVLACSNDDGPAETSAADAPVRSTTTTAPPPPVLERVALGASVFGGDGDQRLTAVATGVAPGIGGRLVAVGTADGRPAVWWSSDGRVWERAPLGAGAFGEGTTLADVVADPVGGGWVAVGADGEAAAAWASADGEVWQRAQVDPGPPMTTVGATRAGLIAFGVGQESVAWQSFSGMRWVRALDDPDVFARPGAVRVVAVVDAGREVQAVVDREGHGPEVWRSEDGIFWSRSLLTDIDLLPAGGAPGAGAAAALGSALVVGGSDAKDDGVDAALWISTDARSFEQVAHDERTFGGDGAQAITGLVSVADRLVGVGTEIADHGDVDAVVWITSLGAGTERADDDGVAVPGDQHVLDVAVLGDTPVAVGWEETPAGVDAAAWVVATAEADPADAEAAEGPVLGWQRVSGEEALAGVGEQRMEAVAPLGRFGAVGWIAVGSVPGSGDDTDGAVWRSIDGHRWDLTQTFGGPGDQRLLGVAPGASGLAAVGVDGESAAVWSSGDGSALVRVPHDDAVFGGPGDQQARAVSPLPGVVGWLAVGSDGGAGEGDAAVWLSLDGSSWERVADDGALGGAGAQALHGVTAGDGGLTAVGVDGASAAAWSSTDGRTWVQSELGPGQASGIAARPGGAVVAVGSTAGDGLDAAVWRSADGRTRERVTGDDLSGHADQELAAVTAGDDLAVVVGRSDRGGGDDAAAWASNDGAAWARAPHDENVFGSDQAQRMAAVAAQEGMVVAVGWSGSTPESRDAAVWVAELRGGGGRSNL